MADEAFRDILDFSQQHNALIRYPDVADFKSIVRGAAQNEVWRDTTSETMWEILSSCGKDINNIVANGAIDYVQNLADINTARIPALVSMGAMLKYETGSLLELYSTFPTGLQLMLDVLSVDREYLFSGDSPILSIPLVRKMMEKMKVGLMRMADKDYLETMALEDVFTEVKRNSHRVNDEVYYDFIKEVFYELILDVLGATYSETDHTALIDNLLHAELSSYEWQDSVLRNTILDKVIRGESRHPLDIDATSGSSITLDPAIKVNANESYSSLAEQVEAIRRTYNVSQSFNPWVVADQINEHGLSPGNELTENEKILVETILNAHNKERFDYAAGHYRLGSIDTRYGYYREKEFIKYLRAFIILHSLKVQAVNLDVTTLNLVNISVVNKKDTCVLDLFTYVNEEWVYEQESAGGEEDSIADKDGIGWAKVNKPVRTKPGKRFIPRISEESEQFTIEKFGYEYIDKFKSWDRSIALENGKARDILDVVADKLAELVFKIHAMRNEMKRQAQFNAMRGTGSLLAHSINDFLLTKYPTEQFEIVPKWSSKRSYDGMVKDIAEDPDIDELERLTRLAELQSRISENIKLFRNFTNVDIIEYMDTTEYFNIHPTGLYTNDDVLLNTRYWEQLSKAITNRDKAQLGVFSPNEIREFYRNNLSMGSLHSTTEVEDDIEEFLLSLYEAGATDAHYDEESGNIIHPINDIANEDNLFAYESKSDRMKVQNNAELVEKQDKQFLRYSSNTSMLGENRNRNGSGQIIEAFNWKNTKYASVMLHPFMYTFQLWNPLVNILINAMSEYITADLERNLTNKKIFDELYGTYGESKDFWKYNVLDFTGYVTRYEHEKHDKTDAVGETSPLTGYDGLFYPSAVKEFIDAYERTAWEKQMTEATGLNRDVLIRPVRDFTPRIGYERDRYLKSIFVSNTIDEASDVAAARLDAYEQMAYSGDKDEYRELYGAPKPGDTFEQVIASIYWQIEFKRKEDGTEISKISDLNTANYLTYYGKWFAHLGYSDERCKHIAKQLWYWRERIVDAATHRYAVCNYNLDLGNNSMFLMDTFTDELRGKELLEGRDEAEQRNYAIEALDAALAATNNFVERSVNENNNTTAGKCFTPVVRPKELWIRWNAEPIALPAFDVYWDNEKLQERWFDESSPNDNTTSLGSAGRFQEFGQIKYKDSTTNDAISDAIENFLAVYTLDGSGADMKRGNKAPIFYSFQQNADVLAFATWRRIVDENSLLSNYDRTALCPIHILCREVQDAEGSYLFERFLQDTPTIDPIGKFVYDSHLSAQYIFDATGGNLIIPTYRISTPRAITDDEHPEDSENATVLRNQVVYIKLFGLSCQSIVKSGYETREKLVTYDERPIFINADNLFSGTVLISNGTSVLFSLDGEKLGLAFLGNLTAKALDIVSKTLAGGCTRYLADSDPQEKIALLRKKFYRVKGEVDGDVDNHEIGTYADLRISDADGNIWNSFDRNDKFVCVIQYDGALDPGTWQLESKNTSKFSSRLLNLVSDASYIPEFAYQSPKDFERFPEVSGTTYLHQATYFGLKDHWAIQLLGLENNIMLDFVKVAQDLIVHDETDNVDTYVNPGQVVDAIYRIWEQSEMADSEVGIERLYNPKMIFDPVSKMATWTETWLVNESGKEAFLNRHISIVRCNENKDGEILNEKNWILATINIKDLVDDLSKQNPGGDEFRRVSLDDFYTVALENDGHSCRSTSHILVGTQDPYKYSADPDWATTLRSPAYLLQYGNGIAGARRCEVGVFIEKRTEDEELPDTGDEYPTRDEAPYRIRIEVRLYKEDDEVRDRETEEIRTYMDSVDVIPPKCMLMAISQDEVEHLADYHMLVHHDDIFYNIPNNDEDDALREEYDERLDTPDNPPPHNPPKNFLDYLYIYEGSAAFKINEQSDKFCTFDWEHPTAELDKLLYNFRKNQVDLNCLYPWSTYVTQEHNPKVPHVSSIDMETVTGTDCRGLEDYDSTKLNIENLVIDSNADDSLKTFDIVIMLDTTGSMPSENTYLKESITELCRKMLEYNPDNRIAVVRYYQPWYYSPGDRDPANTYFYNSDTSLSKYSENNEKLYLGKKLFFTGNITTITKVLKQTYTSWPAGATNRGTSTWQGDNTFWQNMNDENLWTTLKIVTDPDLAWRKNAHRMLIYISDEADDNYVPVIGKTWVATINGQRLNYEGAYDAAQFNDSRVVWTPTNRVDETNHTVRQQYNWGNIPNGNTATLYYSDHINAKIFQRVMNRFGIQMHYVETEIKTIPSTDIKTMRQRIDWVDTYVYRVQKDLMDGLTYGGYTYSIEPQDLATTLQYIFTNELTPGLDPIWQYTVQPDDSTADILRRMVNAGYSIHTWEAGGNNETGGGSILSIDVSDEDFDSTYKVYANYQKIPDEEDPRGYHFDLFFNIQNLFKPPFEYMSKVTHQPAPLILPNSYLCLPGDKASRLECSGGKLTLYAQLKWLVNDLTSSVKTLPLVTYDIYNISDDKPKFLLKRTKDAENSLPVAPTIFLKFEDVTIDGAGIVDENGLLTQSVNVVQAVSVHYNNDLSSEFNRLASLRFNIVQNDSVPAVSVGLAETPPYIDIDKTEKFCSYPPNEDLAIQGGEDRPYPERFNNSYAFMGKEKRGYSVVYTYQDSGYTNEDLYLYWTIPAGLNISRAIQTIGCIVEDTAIRCVAKMRSGDSPKVIAQPGHIYMNSVAGAAKYLGRERGRHLNKFGYVLTRVSDVFKNQKIRLN